MPLKQLINQTLHCLLLELPILSSLAFFDKERTTSLKDFPFVFVQRKCDQMGNKDFFLRTKQHFLLPINNLDSLSYKIGI